MTGIKIVAVIAGPVNPSSCIRQKNYRKNAGDSQSFGKPRPAVPYAGEKKKPGEPGFFDEYFP
jgi:hypothetical protein